MVAVDNPRNADELPEVITAAGAHLRGLVDVNAGMNRCGMHAQEAAPARRVASSQGLLFAGVMSYQ